MVVSAQGCGGHGHSVSGRCEESVKVEIKDRRTRTGGGEENKGKDRRRRREGKRTRLGQRWVEECVGRDGRNKGNAKDVDRNCWRI